MEELRSAGLGEFATRTDGPLLRATLGGASEVSCHMPIDPTSTYAKNSQVLQRAYELANADGPDPELDLQGLKTPLWSSHSLRRGGDRILRQWPHHQQHGGECRRRHRGWHEQYALSQP